MKKNLILELLKEKKYKEIHNELMQLNDIDVAYLLDQLDITDCAIAFRMLSKTKAANVFAFMSVKRQSDLVELFSEKELRSLLEDQYMDDIVYGFEVEHGKPAPDIFLKACEKLDVLPNEALVLEDSEAGIDSAYQAHIPVICIPDLKEPDEVHKERTACLLSSLDQVIEYIEKSNG